MNRNIINIIIIKNWKVIFSDQVLRRLISNFSFIIRHNFVFPLTGYVSVVNYLKTKKCCVCNSIFENLEEFHNHSFNSEHISRAINKYKWLADDKRDASAYGELEEYIEHYTLRYSIIRDFYALSRCANPAYSVDFYI